MEPPSLLPPLTPNCGRPSKRPEEERLVLFRKETLPLSLTCVIDLKKKKPLAFSPAIGV